LNWRIEFDPRAGDELRALDFDVQRRIVSYLDQRVRRNPRAFGKPLRGDWKGLWRYRVGDFRRLCEIDDVAALVTVVHVAHRSIAYD
jgi:mRNA interferase RelE/StbE